MKKFLGISLIALFAFTAGAFLAPKIALSTWDIATWTGFGSRNNTVEWRIQSSVNGQPADILPGTTAVNSIGNATIYPKEVNAVYLGLAAATATTTTPARAGLLIRNSSNELYISTGTGPAAWVKVGAQ